MLHLIPVIIACLFAIFSFTKLDNLSRFLAVQVFIAFLVEFIGWQIKLQHHKNVWLYNSYMPVEFSLLFFATNRNGARSKQLLYSMILVFYWCCWGAEILMNSIESFAVKSYVIGAIILLVSYFFVLYKSALNRNSLLRQSGFWFAIGVILFFGCNVPFFAMYDYIGENSTRYQMKLLTTLMLVFFHLRYLFMAVGFIVVYRKVIKRNVKITANAE